MSAARRPQAQALLYHARNATPFCSENGEPLASIPAGIDARAVSGIRSASFRDWLTANFYNEFETAPSATALRAALRTLEARARYGESGAQRVDYRLGFAGDPFLPSKIILDLANHGELLEITSHGWSTTANLRHPFRQSTTSLPLPRPAASENCPDPLEALRALLNIPPEDPWHRCLAWLAGALRPRPPYPILVITGPAGSGKTFLARVLRALIDPSVAPVRRLPARDRHLLQLAFHNWILVFDLVHRVPTKISETLCALSSGDALEIAQPDLRDPLVFEIARPVILVSPQDETQRAWTPPRTLANRTLTIQLARIAHPRPEAALWSRFQALRSPLLAALADAVSTALRRFRDIDLGNVARFPDCAAWAAAAAPALGLPEPAVLTAFADPASFWSGRDPLREAIHALLASTGVWTGPAEALLNQLRATVPLAALPSTPKGLSQALPRIPGICLSRARNEAGQRILTLTRILDASRTFAGSDIPAAPVSL